VEPISLTIGAVIAGLVFKASDRAETGVVDAAANAVSKVVSWVSQHLPGGKDSALARLQDAPDSASRAAALAAEVDDLAGQPELRTELLALIEEVRSAGATTQQVNQSAWGSSIVQAANINDSEIRISYGDKSAG
jgi:hypothetical protein